MFLKKLSVVAAVCAVSRVGHCEREKIEISAEAKLKIECEVKGFLEDWQKSNMAVRNFYESRPSVLVRDCESLVSVLTKDLLEYLAWGADRYDTFSKFESGRLRVFSKTERWGVRVGFFGIRAQSEASSRNKPQ